MLTFRQAAFSLGNQRPDFLAATERSLWTALARICFGSSAIHELSRFLNDFQALETRFKGVDAETNWFAMNRQFYFRLGNRITELHSGRITAPKSGGQSNHGKSARDGEQSGQGLPPSGEDQREQPDPPPAGEGAALGVVTRSQAKGGDKESQDTSKPVESARRPPPKKRRKKKKKRVDIGEQGEGRARSIDKTSRPQPVIIDLTGDVSPSSIFLCRAHSCYSRHTVNQNFLAFRNLLYVDSLIPQDDADGQWSDIEGERRDQDVRWRIP
jgi:hypothetical protein